MAGQPTTPYFGDNDLMILLLKIKDLLTHYVRTQYKTGSTGEYKVLSDNNLTDEMVTKIRESGTSNFSGSYNDLTDKPTLVTKTSELTDDLGLAKTSEIPTKLSDLDNDKLYQSQTQVQLTVNSAVSGLASQEYVRQQISALIGEGTPEELDTLREIADKLSGSDSDISALTKVVAQKLDASSLVEITSDEIETIWNSVFNS